MIDEIVVPAVLTAARIVDPGEIRLVALTLPETWEVGGRAYPIRDTMRPGNAFLAKPMGSRTGKIRRRMYSRSNCALTSPWVLETIINHTHEPRADSSIWWQSEAIDGLLASGDPVDVRVDMSHDRTHLVVYENAAECRPTNLRLEPDEEWFGMRIVALALSTGITPFLSYVRFMKARRFGRDEHPPGCRFTLIASARNPRQLMEHEELLAVAEEFPGHFRYWPVLTRDWPESWPYGRGRMIRISNGGEGEPRIDLGPLLEVVPDLADAHLRFCGNVEARQQLTVGLRQQGLNVLSLRAESW